MKPTRIYTKPLDDVGEEWSGDEDDTVDEVIIPGTDWESVNYVYKKFPAEVSYLVLYPHYCQLRHSFHSQSMRSFLLLIFTFRAGYFSDS